MVLHIDGDLLVRLAMENSKGRSDFYFVFIPDAKEGSNDTFLRVGSAEVVVEDGEEGNGVDSDIGWGASILFTIVFIVLCTTERRQTHGAGWDGSEAT